MNDAQNMIGTPRDAPQALVVIPAFRETARLPHFLGPLLSAFRAAGIRALVRVVDDGSPPEERAGMAKIIDSLASDFPELLPLIALPTNAGKGAAVYSGWDAGPSLPLLCFCDADGSIAPGETARLLALALAPDFSADALVASRHAPGARVTHRGVVRAALSRAFAFWIRIAVGLRVRDAQCGFKCVRSETYAAIRAGLRERRFAFDTELLASVAARGGVIREEPARWDEREGSTLSIRREAWRMTVSVFRTGARHRAAIIARRKAPKTSPRSARDG